MPAFTEIQNLFWLLLLLPALWILYAYIKWRKNALNKLVNPRLRDLVFPAKHQNKSIYYGLYICGSIVFLILALANLQIGRKPRKATRAGMDIVLAIDVSRSMDAQDLKPSRMAQTKHFAQQLINGLPQDKIGLVLFAGNAYIQLPLTTDLAAANMFINTINTDIAPTQGTSVKDAISQSMSLLFPKSSPKQNQEAAKVIIVISDGENHEEGAEKVAKEAAESGAVIYTVGVGTSQGAPIPVKQNGNITLQKDEAGETVISRLNQEFLKNVASQSKGKYFYLAGNRNAAKNLVTELHNLKRGETEVMVFDEYESYFQLFAGLALLLLLAEPLQTIMLKSRKPDI